MKATVISAATAALCALGVMNGTAGAFIYNTGHDIPATALNGGLRWDAQSRIVACKAAFLADGFLAGDTSYVLWGHGGTGRALRRALAAHGKRPSHVVEVHPGRIGNRIDGAPVVSPDRLTTMTRGRLVASVSGAEARGDIRAFLTAIGWEEVRDYVVAA